MATITDRINTNEIILLDGGVSTELLKRGVPLDANVWSGLTTKSHPNQVLQVHEDYIRAGSAGPTDYKLVALVDPAVKRFTSAKSICNGP